MERVHKGRSLTHPAGSDPNLEVPRPEKPDSVKFWSKFTATSEKFPIEEQSDELRGHS
jgi:hypothetical protein